MKSHKEKRRGKVFHAWGPSWSYTLCPAATRDDPATTGRVAPCSASATEEQELLGHPWEIQIPCCPT